MKTFLIFIMLAFVMILSLAVASGQSVAPTFHLYAEEYQGPAWWGGVLKEEDRSYSAVVICVGGQLRFYRGTNPDDRGILFCESGTPQATETPRPLYTARPLVGGTIPQVTETPIPTSPPVGHVVNLPFVSNGE